MHSWELMYSVEILYGRGTHARIQRGVQGGPSPPPLKNHKSIGFLSNTGPDLLNNHKATSHFRIRRFTCCLNMGLNLKILKMSPALFA